MRTWNVRLLGFSILHVLGTISIPLLIFLLTSCIKKEDVPVDYGPAVSAESVSEALYLGTGGKTLADSKVSDWALFEGTLRVFTQPNQTNELSSKQITAKVENGDRYDLQILKVTYDHTQNPPTVSNQQMEQCQVLKDGSDHSCSYSPMFSEFAAFDIGPREFSYVADDMTISPRAGSVTYHRLSVVQRQQPPPPLVAQRTNCGGVPGCVMNVTVVEFDEVVRGSETTRYHHEVTLSKDGPFLSIKLSHCIKFNAKVDTRYLPATLCDYVRNFEYGN